MVWVVNIKQVASLLSVVLAAEENIDFFEWNVFGFGDEEPNEQRQTDITCHEEEERLTASLLAMFSKSGEIFIQAAVCVECREELVENNLSHVLHLRAHADGLRSDVHRENLRRPNPGRSTP